MVMDSCIKALSLIPFLSYQRSYFIETRAFFSEANPTLMSMIKFLSLSLFYPPLVTVFLFRKPWLAARLAQPATVRRAGDRSFKSHSG